jgi:hypothetical protein
MEVKNMSRTAAKSGLTGKGSTWKKRFGFGQGPYNPHPTLPKQEETYSPVTKIFLILLVLSALFALSRLV